MAIEIIKNNASARAVIETSDIFKAQVWRNHNGSTLMTVPNAQDAGCYSLLALDTNGVIECTSTLRTVELVNHLNRHLFEEINCTIELNL